MSFTDSTGRLVGDAEELQSKQAQAKHYLQLTNSIAVTGTLTAEQIRLRDKAQLLLDGLFVEPPSDLFDV